MSAIRERTTLCVVDIPKKLTSHKHFLAYFSKFGEIEYVSVNEDLKSGIVKFTTHFGAQSAKTQGRIFEGKLLNIYWSESTSIDPRAKDEQDSKLANIEQLWDNDDKECFGIEVNSREARKHSAKDMIKKHLKVSGIKARLSLDTKTNGEKKGEKPKSQKSLGKRTETASKTSMALKKSGLNPGVKRKIVRKVEGPLRSTMNKQKKSPTDLSSDKPPVIYSVEKTDLKHKLELLDERDKIIRKGMIQDSNINTAVTTKGTCPDMCPERERILRQWGHAVAVYELIPGTNEMDENRAVKEYIRSSADQEVPLPHDLRPGPVLSRTMNYLLANIITRVDKTDENKAVWYSFCWNRLRSIRKDIILQQLCDIETVTIVEQCARFHICCYDHMWGAVVSGFDDKINTQNLIDCLQTLKHMYEDLGKRGVSCHNEPEFYSYLILLKLKSGDVMWEYQQYSLNIQLSEEVQFAIEAYMAFKNNRYSRYFNLVKKASYLTACLMQRYFDQVRNQALKTMMRAYCLPNKTVGLSSSFIVSSLKFDSTKNAVRFCERKEVEVKVDSDGIEDVYVSTSSFLIREKRLPIANAVVGTNNRIPEYIPHNVTSSFNEFGKLISSTYKSDENNDKSIINDNVPNKEKGNPEITVSDVSHQSTFKFSLSPTTLPENIFGKIPFFNQANVLSNQPSIDSFVNNDEIIKTDVNNYDPSNKAFEIEIDPGGEMVCEDSELLKGPISNSIHETSEREELTSKSQIGFQQPFLIPSLTPVKESSSKGKVNEALKDNSPKLTRIQDKFDFKTDIKASSEFSFTTITTQKLFSNITIPELQKPEPKEIGSSLNILASHNVSRKRRHINNTEILLDVNPKQLDKKEILDDTSDIEKCQPVSVKECKSIQLEKLHREKEELKRLQLEENQRLDKIKKQNAELTYFKILKKDVRQRCKVISARKCARLWRLKIEKVKKARADFPLLFQLSVKDYLSKWGSMNSVPTNRILLRARNQRNTLQIISKLLTSGVSDSCRYLGEELAETIAKSASRTMKKAAVTPVYWKLAISVPCASNSYSTLSVFNKLMRMWCRQSFYKQEGACLGSVERVITSLEIPVNMSTHLYDTMESNRQLQGMDALLFLVLNETETEKTCIERLKDLVSSPVKSNGCSIVVMNIGGSYLESILKMELQELQERNVVAHYKICTWLNPSSIVDSLQFLAEKVDVIPHICASSMEVLIKHVSEEFFDALSCNQHSNEALAVALKNPNNIILLYNICLAKLEDLLSSSKLEKYFNFANEFESHVPPDESGGPELLCGKYYDDNYKGNLIKLMNSLKLPELSKWPARSPNRLVKMLKAYCNQVNDIGIFPQIIRMLDLPDQGDLQQHLQQVSWLNIVELWSQCTIRDILCSKDKSKQFFVIYNKNSIQSLIQKQWWLKLSVVMEQKVV